MILDSTILQCLGDLINDEGGNSHIESKLGECESLCLDCNKRYVGETCLNIDERIYEHRKYLKRAGINNGLVKHNLETNHNFNFGDFRNLVYIHFEDSRIWVYIHWFTYMENCWTISSDNTIKPEGGLFNLSPYECACVCVNWCWCDGKLVAE